MATLRIPIKTVCMLIPSFFLSMFWNFWWQANLKFKFMEMSVENQKRWKNRWKICQKAPHMHALQMIFHTFIRPHSHIQCWANACFERLVRIWNGVTWFFGVVKTWKVDEKNLHTCTPFDIMFYQHRNKSKMTQPVRMGIQTTNSNFKWN